MTGGSVWKGAGPRTVQYRHGRSIILGPITSTHSRIKSRIVIPYSSCIIMRYIGEYSSPVYRIILAALLYRCANPPHNPAYVYPFFLPTFPPCPPFCLPRLFRSSKWKHLCFGTPLGKTGPTHNWSDSWKKSYAHSCMIAETKALFLKRTYFEFPCDLIEGPARTASLKVDAPIVAFYQSFYIV